MHDSGKCLFSIAVDELMIMSFAVNKSFLWPMLIIYAIICNLLLLYVRLVLDGIF